MPPRKVKVVSMGASAEEETTTIPTSTVIEFDGDLDAKEAPTQETEAPEPQAPTESKDFLDSEEIDRMIEETKQTKKSSEKATCYECGKTMSLKSLKYSHSKICKGLQPGDIQIVETPEPEPEPEPEPIKVKKPRAKPVPKPKPEPAEEKVKEATKPKAIKTTDPIAELRAERQQLRQVRISLLASQAF